MKNIKVISIAPILIMVLTLTILGCSSDNIDPLVIDNENTNTETNGDVGMGKTTTGNADTTGSDTGNPDTGNETASGDYYLRFKLNDEMVDYSLSAKAQINVAIADGAYSSSFFGLKEIGPLTYATFSILFSALDFGPIQKETYSNPSFYENYDEETFLPIYPNILATLSFPPNKAYVSRSAEIMIIELEDTWVSGTFTAELTTATNHDTVIYTITEGEFKLENTNQN